MKKFVSNNPEELKKIAKDLAVNLMSRSRLDIGGGTLGVKEKVKSSTFIIFRKSKIIPLLAGQNSKFRCFYHFDVYRINSEKEILNLGWEEIISNSENIVLVEWADKIEKILPKNSVKINFKHLKWDKRGIVLNVT